MILHRHTFRAAAALLVTATLTACNSSGSTSVQALQSVVLEDVARTGHTRHLKYGDHDAVAIKGRQPKNFDVHGIDLSRHNKAIDWATVKRSGIDFAFIKATEGGNDGDRRFAELWSAAKRAGIPRSAYHFYYFCASPEKQARNYIARVPKSHTSLPPILDVEWNPESPTCTKRDAPKKVRGELSRFLKIIERHYGQKPIIYTTVDFHRENLAGGELPGYQYWLRSVTAEPHHKYGNRPWTFWQYTGTGKVPGIEGPVDINAWKGSRAEWNRWLQRNTRG
ncbi:glycoside hydrolase family 25 protein [Rhizobiaceae bacterium]|nr:glycoside hydrolase family 25 protein [Rhizobiaceae bacterium]